MGLVFSLQILSCFFMTGVIWTIQIVHYPTFGFTREQFDEFHKFHSNRITWVVLPMMAVELLTASLIVYSNISVLWLSNLLGVLATWVATGLVSVPLHRRLSKTFEVEAAQKLVATNWIRTSIWSVRSISFLVLLSDLLKQ